MPAVLDERQQWQGADGKPLVNGSIAIGDVGADPLTNPQDIFADREFTVPIANPQLADAFGQTASKIWVRGRYSILVRDLNNVQQYQELDNGDPESASIITLTNVQGASTITASGVPTISGYIDKQVYVFKSVSTLSGTPATLNIDNIGAKEITYPIGDPLKLLQWGANQNISVMYNETSDTFIWGQVDVLGMTEAVVGTSDVPKLVTAALMASAIAAQTTLPRAYLAGLGTVQAADPDHDITINDGVARDDANTEDIELSAPITKQLDAAWSVGDGQGGLDTGSVAIDTWYHYFVIKRTDTNVVDALFSLSPTAPTLPTPGYDKFRRVWSVLTDGSGNIIDYVQEGDSCLWFQPPLDVSTAAQGTTSISYTLSTPLGIKCGVNFAVRGSVSDALIYVRSLDQDDEVVPTVTSVVPPGGRPWTINYDNTGGTSPSQSVEKLLRTDLNSQIAARADQAGAAIEILTIGYIDPRGRSD